MFNGFLEHAGVEWINAERVEQYLKNEAPSISLRPTKEVHDTIHVALGDSPYQSPLVDMAEWVDVNDPATHRFYGMYPLSFQGFGDSTREASTTESTLDGGTVGESRHTSRELRIKGVLLGADDLAVEAGLTWLRAVVAEEGCGMHDSMCGSSDLRFFLATPEVCNPRWAERILPRVVVDLGSLNRESSPLIYQLPTEPTMPMEVEWLLPRLDGVSVSWGAIEPLSGTVLEASPFTTLQRTNLIPNPSFTVGVDGWTFSTPLVHFERVAVGGVNDGAYADAIESDPSLTRTNWAADPNFTLNPADAGWRSSGEMSNPVDITSLSGGTTGKFQIVISGTSGAYGVEPYGETPYGGTLLSSQAGYGQTPYGQTPYGGQLAGLSADITLQGPGPTPQQTTISFDHSPQMTLVATVLNEQFVQVAQTTFAATAGWSRVSMTASVAAGYTFRVTTTAASMQLDRMLVEPGAVAGGYFDGDSLDTVSSTYFYLTGNAVSPSRVLTGQRVPYQVWASLPDSGSSALRASFSIRSSDSPTVTAQVIANADETVLAERVLTLSEAWTRIELATEYGRNTRLQFNAIGTFDLDEVLVENSESLEDYFDASLPAPADYTVSWLGIPHLSPSRLIWTGKATTARDDSDWRPYIEAEQGAVGNVQLAYSTRVSVPMQTQLEPYERTYHRVSVVGGPKVLKRYSLGSGSAIDVEIILVAGTPFAYSSSRTVPQQSRSNGTFVDPVVATTPAVNPLIDPNCPPSPLPPRPPAITEICLNNSITTWKRYWYEIPADQVASWASTVPTISLSSRLQEIRQLRVRFHPNPFLFPKEDVDPDSYCGEFIVSYLPSDTVLSANGMIERAYARVAAGEPVPADHLLYGTGGAPMTWPVLSCGIPYVLTVDIPPANNIDNLDVSIVTNRKE